MNSKIRLALIIVGMREQDACLSISRWACEVIAQRGEFETCVIDAASITCDRNDPWVECRRHLIKADAYLVIALKPQDTCLHDLQTLVESVPVRWDAKPVAFIGYGLKSQTTSVVRGLRRALADHHVVPVHDTVPSINSHELSDENGSVLEPDRLRLPMARMLMQLQWLASALRTAREHVCYELVS